MTAKEPNSFDQYSDTNERDMEQKQSESVPSSEAFAQDPSIDSGAVNVLPGTGGPDDNGDIDLVPDDYDPTGHAGGRSAPEVDEHE
jgi:hypothetical protein